MEEGLFFLFRPGILETSCLSHQDNLHLGKLHARWPRDGCGCTDPVDACPRNLPNYFQNQPGPRKLGFLEMPLWPKGNLAVPPRTGFVGEWTTYLTYWLRGSHWLCHPGRSADGSRCPLCSTGCRSGAPKGSTGSCCALSRFLGCPGKPRLVRRQKMRKTPCYFCPGRRWSLRGSLEPRVALREWGASPREPKRWGSGGCRRGGSARTSSFFRPRGS